MTGPKCSVFRFSDVEVHERELQLKRAGEALPVEPKAFRVLLYLLRNPGRLIRKDELLNAGWGDTAVTDNSLTRNIALLRRLLDDDTHAPRYIETVSTVGYRFICPVEAIEDSTVGPEAAVAAGNSGEGSVMTVSPTVVPVIPAKSELHWRRWLWPSLAALGVAALAVWYLRRPLPPLQVTEYTQITHDGRPKDIAGTDGSRLYFNSDYGPQHNSQVAISGGEIAPVPVALPLPAIKDVSPDGSTLLVASYDGGHGSLWSVQIPAGSLRQLLKDVWVNSAAWSPDGKSVVYSAGDNDLYVLQSDGTANRKLADVGGPSNTLSWSPDGSKIRLSWENRLWEMSSDGSGLHPLLPGWRPSSSQCCGLWSPDGKFFVFLSRGGLWNFYGPRPGSQVWVLDERHGLFRRASTEPVQLTSGPIRWNTPIPSKDGTKIFAQGVILRGELVRFDAQSHRLQPWLGGISAEFVSFSPDGQSVAYVTFPEGILWKANRDGSNPVQLTDPPLHPINPRWSPDGARILFYQIDSAGHSRNYIVPSQGGTPRLLLPEEKEGTSDANWSPDGRKIVFSSVQSVEAIDSLNSVVRILDVGSHLITTLPESDGVFSPRWSPNGRFIAGLSSRNWGTSRRRLKVFDFETQRWSVLQHKGRINWPSWSSNSQFIYFLASRAGDDSGVFRVRVSDGVEERVVDLKGFHHTGAYTHWFGLDLQDTPMLLRDVGTADIYALTLETK